ncbi:hypothetical protein COV19_00200 [Candidatus Woesearchaeota archaeon CG10_big_fil_rev_8_21_14_0_10_44_13]|nr:MAG: hypothetical protein COV19_00200 [Candidatus Woesearchaeota archaeon CG10_big_fil_rev_8_21_14_0_10_44_13]
MVVRYKQKCTRCKKNYVLSGWRDRYPLCYECQKSELVGNIKDPKMKKLFNIPEEYYRENAFLRNIKITYLKFKRLTDPQIEAFKKVAKKMKDEKAGIKSDDKKNR